MSTTAIHTPPAPGPTDHHVAPGRYTRVAVWLHWIIAAIIVAQLIGGVVMHKLPNTVAWKYDAYQMHKSFGLVVLALALVRLGWRLTHKAPPLPEGTKTWERLLARGTHVAFYVLMIGVPLAGWWMISGSQYPSSFFFLAPIPDLPGAGILGHEAWEETHEIMAKLVMGLLALHVAAALKHHYVDRDGVLARMVPGLAKPRPAS